MAVEEKRGCGYRKIGGMYLVGEALTIGCDRLPLQLESCPVCGAGIHFTRGMTEIFPLDLLGTHDEKATVFKGNPKVEGEVTKVNCFDKVRPCEVCDPTNELAYVMMVGEKHYPTIVHFMEEANRIGVSKRIPFIPKKLKMGETIIYLAHPKACKVPVPPENDSESPQQRLVDAQKTGGALGLFMTFRPRAIEMPVYKKNLTKKKKAELKKRGITPIEIPNNDLDHQ